METIVGLDFETYFDSDYSLKKLSTTAYIRSPQFLVHGVGIRTSRQSRTFWYQGMNAAFNALHKFDWTKAALLAHNAHFEGLILHHHFGIDPMYYYDTVSMGRIVYGTEVRAGLDILSRHLGFGQKVESYLTGVKGERSPSKKDMALLAKGCRQDVDLMWKVFNHIKDKFPETEMDLINLTIQCYAQPMLKVNKELAAKEHKKEVNRRREVVRKVFLGKGQHLTQTRLDESIKKLRSREKFAAQLRALDVEPPLKVSPTTEKLTYAFAKNDLEFLSLQEHPDEQVRNLVEAKLIASSSIHETRPLRMIDHADPALPIFLNYAGAKNTHRWCMKGDAEVLTLTGWVRMDEWNHQSIVQWHAGILSWCVPTMNQFIFSGELVELDTRYAKGAFTPSHTLPTYTSKSTFLVRTAHDAYGLNITIPVSARLDGVSTILGRAKIQLIVAFQADGYIDRNRIKFGFRKQRKITRLTEILNTLSIEFKVWVRPKETLITFLKTEAGYLNKEFCLEQLLGLSYNRKRIFIKELRYWDGAINGAQIRYFTTNKRNAEIVHTLAHVCNCRAYISTETRQPPHNDKHTVQITPNQTLTYPKAKAWSSQPYSGYVYCPTVRTGFFLVKSKGTIFVTGNSGGDKMNPQNQSRTGELRHAIVAPKGYKLVIGDSGAIEARLNGYMAGQEDLMDQFRTYDETVRRGKPDEREEPYCRFASKLFNRTITKKDKTERYIGKVCIAKGQLVLTDRGLVPIEKVPINTKVWDGIEWVPHDGVVFQGFKEVITYDELTATPDHGVFTDQLGSLSLQQASAELENLSTTGDGKQPIQIGNRKAGQERAKTALLTSTKAVAVYDILNCGPRHRFTVSNKLVSNCVLALGYNMGATRLQFTLETGGLGPRITLSYELYKQYVDMYRSEMNMIVALWRYMQARLLDMTNPDYFGSYKCIEFGYQKITPPNELPLRYPNLRKNEEGDFVYRENTKLYGGKISEHVCQNLARTVVAEQLLTVAKHHRIVLMVHDEGVFCVPTRKAKAVARDLLTALSTPPEWAPDLPVTGEVGIFDHYVKM